jgi:hypothetical protein
MSGFNQLTDAESEALALLAEECAETIQIIGKILRHGIDSCHPETDECNRDLLEGELGDVRAAESIVIRVFGLSSSGIADYKRDKLGRVGRYLHHVDLLVVAARSGRL